LGGQVKKHERGLTAKQKRDEHMSKGYRQMKYRKKKRKIIKKISERITRIWRRPEEDPDPVGATMQKGYAERTPIAVFIYLCRMNCMSLIGST